MSSTDDGSGGSVSDRLMVILEPLESSHSGAVTTKSETPPVWCWEDSDLGLYHLREHGYEQIQQSELSGLRDLDLTVQHTTS